MRTGKLSTEYGIDIRITHFPLHPDTPEEGLSLEKLFAGKNFDIKAANSRLAGLMAQEGLPSGDRTMTYNSRLAQELSSWAANGPGQERLHQALFEAYFVHNVNLARVDELVRIAEQAGLDGAEAREVVEGRSFRDAVDADWRRSRELGITGIPTFKVGEQTVSGAQSYQTLEALVLEAGAAPRDSF